jgi:hypothetical protein
MLRSEHKTWWALLALVLLGVGLFHGIHHHEDEPDCSTCILLPALVLAILGFVHLFFSTSISAPIDSTTAPTNSILFGTRPVRGPPSPFQI